MHRLAGCIEFYVDTEKDGIGHSRSAVPFYLLEQGVALSVSWGDGSSTVLVPSMYSTANADASIHEYAVPGKYCITVEIEQGRWSSLYVTSLDCPDAEFETAERFNPKMEYMRLFKKTLVGLPSPFPRLLGTLQFFSTDPAEQDCGHRMNGDMSCIFLHCTSLEFIADGLFKNNRNAMSFAYAFYGCRSLKSVPGNIFKGCSEVETFDYAFYGCSRLNTLPPELFQSAHKAKSFKGCFKDCGRLKFIPDGLFHGTPLAEIFSECFQNCTRLSCIPEGLFSRTPGALSFSRAFENCASILAIPECLFWNCRSASFFKAAFSKTAIEFIPETLFSECPYAVTFAYAFAWCRSLKSVPNGLFAKCINAESFFGCFCGCSSLADVGREAFASNLFCKTMNSLFYGCSSLKRIELNLPLRCLEGTHLMFEKDEDAERTVFVPLGSASGKVLKHKEEKLGIRVVEKPFLAATLKAFLHSIHRSLKKI